MTFDIDKARQQYESAKEALMDITGDITAEQGLVDDAQAKLEVLIDNYIDDIRVDVEERTEQYLEFIAQLNGVIEAAGRNSDVEGVQKLKNIVDDATIVANAAPGNGGD